MEKNSFNFTNLEWLESLAFHYLMTEKDGLTYRGFYGNYEVKSSRVDELLIAGILVMKTEDEREYFYLSDEAKAKVFSDLYCAYNDLRKVQSGEEVMEVVFEKGFLFKEFLFRESELFELAKNYGYWKSSKEGSGLFAFRQERLDELVSSGFLIHEPNVGESYLVSERWRDEFFTFLDSGTFPKEIADTIRRGY